MKKKTVILTYYDDHSEHRYVVFNAGRGKSFIYTSEVKIKIKIQMCKMTGVFIIWIFL
jgi:hypothetical protein